MLLIGVNFWPFWKISVDNLPWLVLLVITLVITVLGILAPCRFTNFANKELTIMKRAGMSVLLVINSRT